MTDRQAALARRRKVVDQRKLAVRATVAAQMFDISVDTFNRHVAPEIKAVRLTGKTKRYPVAELESWLARNAARVLDPSGFDNREATQDPRSRAE
jgi:hypothetical protein